MQWFFQIALSSLSTVLKPVFDFLNKRVDADAQKHISDNTAAGAIAGGAFDAQKNADALKAQVRLAEGKWSPWVVLTIAGFMAPFAWHTWQVVLDSSPWHIEFGPWFVPQLTRHAVGSWHVAALPGLFETTEHAVIQSLFIGAGAAVGAIPIIRALRGRS